MGGGLSFFNTKIQNSTATAVEFLNFAKYQYLFNTKIQNSTAAAVGFWTVLATNIYLIPKLKVQISTAAAVEFLISNFAKYHYLRIFEFRISIF